MSGDLKFRITSIISLIFCFLYLSSFDLAANSANLNLEYSYHVKNVFGDSSRREVLYCYHSKIYNLQDTDISCATLKFKVITGIGSDRLLAKSDEAFDALIRESFKEIVGNRSDHQVAIDESFEEYSRIIIKGVSLERPNRNYLMRCYVDLLYFNDRGSLYCSYADSIVNIIIGSISDAVRVTPSDVELVSIVDGVLRNKGD